MKDFEYRCLFNIHYDIEKNEDVVEYGVECPTPDGLELWEKPDGTRYIKIWSDGQYAIYDWLPIQSAVMKVSKENKS